MTRKRTFTGTGNKHFVTFRCSARRKLLSAPRPRQVVVSVLGSLADRGRTHVSGFVVMPDHVHALLWFDDDTIMPEVMKTWKRLSSHYLLELFGSTSPDVVRELEAVRSGKVVRAVWTRRYYDFNVTSHAKAREKLDYMHYNPVKRGLCRRPADWKWSSAGWYLDQRSVGVSIDPGF